MFDVLIARLEAAAEGGRELDEAIATAIWGPPVPSGNVGEARTLLWWNAGLGRSIAPHFTTSLDTALTLWGNADLDKSYPRQGINLFYACLPGGKMAWAATAWEQKDGSSVIMHLEHATHRVRPISACIAALKARAKEKTP